MNEKDKKRIFEVLENSEQEMISLLSELVSFQTINPPGNNYHTAAQFLSERCNELGLSSFVIQTDDKQVKKSGHDPKKNPRYNVVARWDVGAKKTLHLNGHFDVVPATGDWKTDPHVLVVKKNKLFGRGSYDDLGNLVVFLTSISALKKSNIKPGYNIELSFVCDEETGGECGFRYLVDKGFVKPDFAIGEGRSENYITIGNKGMLFLSVSVKGKSAHAAYSNEFGVNSFENMVKLGIELLKLKKKVVLRKTSQNMENEAKRYATFVMGGELSGGSKINTVPDNSTFTIDRRLNPEEDSDKALAEIMDVINSMKNKQKDFSADVNILNRSEPIVTNSKNEICEVLGAAIGSVFQKKPEFLIISGGSDLRHIANKGVPIVGYSCSGENMHSDNECVYLDSMVKTAKVLALAMLGNRIF
jgi:succinyl-diaminopimelate desuccinylase